MSKLIAKLKSKLKSENKKLIESLKEEINILVSQKEAEITALLDSKQKKFDELSELALNKYNRLRNKIEVEEKSRKTKIEDFLEIKDKFLKEINSSEQKIDKNMRKLDEIKKVLELECKKDQNELLSVKSQLTDLFNQRRSDFEKEVESIHAYDNDVMIESLLENMI